VGSELKVLVKSPYSMYSGYGQDGFGLVRALHHWGCDVYVQPTWLDVPIPEDLLPLFSKTIDPPFDLTINHWSPGELEIRPEARELTRCAVAWSMWEFENCPSRVPVPVTDRRTGKTRMATPKSGLVPHCARRGSLRRRLELFDLLLGYDEVTMHALDAYVPRARGKDKVPLATGILQGGFEAGEWKYNADRDWFAGDFTYLMHGALNKRKRAETSVQAFIELKYEQPSFASARLALHSMVPGPLVFPEMNDLYRDKNLHVYLEAWDHETLQAFYNSGHVLLAPSRGEGKNLPALEFSTTGGVVAATAYGGHLNWMGDAYAYPLPYELTPTWPDRPDAAHDAKVSIQAVKDVMWHTFTHRAEAREKGELAAKVIPSMCDWSVVTEELFRKIRDLVPLVGPEIYDAAMRCRVDPLDRVSRETVTAGWRQEREGRWT
jgi:glycosyltransferase involved in cell wall biosynthesis